MQNDELSHLSQDVPAQIEPIFEHYFDRVFCYVFSHTNDRQVAEDLTGQIFLKIMEALPRYQRRRPMAAWVFTIARNTLISHYRFTFRHPSQSLDAAGLVISNPFTSPDGNTKDVDQYIDLENVVNHLPMKDRELLHLKYAAGLSFEEMGDLLGKNPEAIKMAVHRLLRKLEARMELSK